MENESIFYSNLKQLFTIALSHINNDEPKTEREFLLANKIQETIRFIELRETLVGERQRSEPCVE